MKPRPRRIVKHAAVSALVNGLWTPMTNLSAISQTLASGRVGGRMAREYAVMCASEATKLTRLVETFVRNELQATVRTRQPGRRKGGVTTTQQIATVLDPAKRRQRRGASTS